MSDTKPMRKIRSFVLREGRMTPRQQQALQAHWSQYGLTLTESPLDLTEVFGNTHPVVLEIGFGMGASLVTMASQQPEHNFIGIEVHRPGIGACLADMTEQSVENLRLYNHDAVEVLKQSIPEASLSRVQIYFPDPWHKKKHHKRRLIQPEFVNLLLSRLKPSGHLHLATDWQHYAEHMLEVLSAHSALRNMSPTGDYIERPDYRPITKFEKRGHRLGHGVWDLLFEKIAD